MGFMFDRYVMSDGMTTNYIDGPSSPFYPFQNITYSELLLILASNITVTATNVYLGVEQYFVETAGDASSSITIYGGGIYNSHLSYPGGNFATVDNSSGNAAWAWVIVHSNDTINATNALWISTTGLVASTTSGMVTQNENNVTMGSNFVVNGESHFNGDMWILGNLFVHNIFTTNTQITATNMNITGSLSVNGNPVLTNAAAFDANGAATNYVLGYSNYVASQNYVDKTVTNGLATTAFVIGTSNSLWLATTNLVKATTNIPTLQMVASVGNTTSNGINIGTNGLSIDGGLLTQITSRVVNYVVSDGGSISPTNPIGEYQYSRTLFNGPITYYLYRHSPDDGWGMEIFTNTGTAYAYISYFVGYYSIGSVQAWRDVFFDERFGSANEDAPGTGIWTGLSGANGASGLANINLNVSRSLSTTNVIGTPSVVVTAFSELTNSIVGKMVLDTATGNSNLYNLVTNRPTYSQLNSATNGLWISVTNDPHYINTITNNQSRVILTGNLTVTNGPDNGLR